MTDEQHQEPRPEVPEMPTDLPVLPLRGLVIFPFTVTPLTVGQERSVRLIDAVMRGSRLIAAVAQRDPEKENAGPDDCYEIGTMGRVAQMARGQEGELVVLVQGIRRIRLNRFTQTEPYLLAEIEPLPERTLTGDEPESVRLELAALQRNVVAQFQKLVELASLPQEMAAMAAQLEDPLQTSYLVASTTRLEVGVRQELLEIDDVADKLRRLSAALSREIEILEIGRRLQTEAQQEMTKAQREYFLREQLKAIQRELGDDDPNRSEVAELRRRLDEAGLPEVAKREVERELERMEAIPPASPERGMIRTYLDWMLSLPWSRSTGGKIDVIRAQQVLDEDHHDLEKVKERILEYLAVRKLKQERGISGELTDTGATTGEVEAVQPLTPGDEAMREPILCLVGPPGVGKTSLGQSIARAMGRKFVRMSLGGVRDEAEIRGHRRTYIGAMPGRIIQGLRRAEANDPVFMLDELDKLTVGFQGDPAAALLEVLDPSQNHTFEDNYLGVPFDLSKVLFICTANVIQNIPGPLLDRMEVLEIPGYTEEEKVLIADRYLVPRQRRANGLADNEITFAMEALRQIVRDYTREAGVRNLERQLATICRKVARDLAMANVAAGSTGSGAGVSDADPGTTPEETNGRTATAPQTPIVITPDVVEQMLGRPRFFSETAERVDRPGVATGLAWTPVGGDMLFVEAAIIPFQQERLILTGQLGDVMRESAQAALSYIQSNLGVYGMDPDVFNGKTVHVHVPAGAIPKDGPSAGVTMLTAITSIVTGRSVRADTAMTGEITLRGKVMPVGGIKEKVLAAHRGGIKTVLLPRLNERDLEGVPDELRRDVRIVPIDTAEQVLAEALGLKAKGDQASTSGERGGATSGDDPLPAAARAGRRSRS